MREEELLSSWWKEYAECSKGPKEQSGSSKTSNKQLQESFSDVSKSETPYEIEERVGVPVKGGLYEVDLFKRHCFPVYWTGENRRVLRGQWFALKGGLNWRPLREYVAEQLEIAYCEQIFKEEIFDLLDSNISAISKGEGALGWQPGISEEASVWDEDWDKFEDEGFANYLTLETRDSFPKRKSPAVYSEKDYSDSSSNANGKIGNRLSTVENGVETESVYSHSEDEVSRSPHDSPAGRSPLGSEEFSDAHHRKGSEMDAETHRRFEETNWGTFDGNDDVDSIWGFSPGNGKESCSETNRDFFGSSDFRVNPIKAGSPQGDSTFPRKNPIFEDSVPSTPQSIFGNSPPRYGEELFNNYSSFDSFSVRDGGFSSQSEKLTRFDSVNSSSEFGRFTRFDSIGSTRDYGQNSQMHTRFNSISSTKDFGHGSTFTFDDADSFGSSGPFKVSSDSQTPKRGSDNWNAF